MEAHLNKTVAFIKHIWLRGALVITKKFKAFKRKSEAVSTWTLKGPVYSEPPRITWDCDGATVLQQYYLRVAATDHIESLFCDFHEQATLDDLRDIREATVYQKYAGGKVRLDQNGY